MPDSLGLLVLLLEKECLCLFLVGRGEKRHRVETRRYRGAENSVKTMSRARATNLFGSAMLLLELEKFNDVARPKQHRGVQRGHEFRICVVNDAEGSTI
ncbi:unnamed protein product [Linum trigynum]|uniref:Secreted protein n=1 Tax=Linum trigynum TaxID=586398 RepID=A0AAV2EM97_9ROSI